MAAPRASAGRSLLCLGVSSGMRMNLNPSSQSVVLMMQVKMVKMLMILNVASVALMAPFFVVQLVYCWAAAWHDGRDPYVAATWLYDNTRPRYEALVFNKPETRPSRLKTETVTKKFRPPDGSEEQTSDLEAAGPKRLLARARRKPKLKPRVAKTGTEVDQSGRVKTSTSPIGSYTPRPVPVRRHLALLRRRGTLIGSRGGAWLYFASAAAKPLVYVTLNANFRRGCREVMCMSAMRCYRRHAYTITTTSTLTLAPPPARGVGGRRGLSSTSTSLRGQKPLALSSFGFDVVGNLLTF